MAWPMSLVAPVTRATFPTNRFSMIFASLYKIDRPKFFKAAEQKMFLDQVEYFAVVRPA
jgi:hypothetical protein